MRVNKHREFREPFDMGILSEADQEWSERAETRVWSPERAVKLHERGALLQQVKI